jgi:hypothetical protein
MKSQSFNNSVVCLTVLLIAAYARADEGFKVENELTIGGVTVKSTTLFSDGIVYNIINDKGTGEITILDPNADRFILLDPVYRLQTRLSVKELQFAAERHRTALLENKQPLLAFVAQPVFDLSIDETTGRMRFQSQWVDYEIATQTVTKKEKEMASEYADYSDLCCYLNFRITPDMLLPLLRLNINQQIRNRNRLPVRVTVTVFPRGKGLLAKSEKLESTHKFVQRISEYDSQKIKEALDMTGRFREVKFEEYQASVAKKK